MSEPVQTAPAGGIANSESKRLPLSTLPVPVHATARPTETGAASAVVGPPRTMRQSIFDAMLDWTTHARIVEVTGFEPNAIWKTLTAKDLQTQIERRREDGQRTEYRHKPSEHPRREKVTDDEGFVWIASRLGAEQIGCSLSRLLSFERGCRYLKGGKKLKYWEPAYQIGHYHREIDIEQIASLWKNGLSTAQLKILGTKQEDGYLEAVRFAKKRTADGKLQLWCRCTRCNRKALVLVILKAFRSGTTKSCSCLRAEQAPINAESGRARMISELKKDETRTDSEGREFVAPRLAMRMLEVKRSTVWAWEINCPWLEGKGIETLPFVGYFRREDVYYLKSDLLKIIKNRDAAPTVPVLNDLHSIRSVKAFLGISSNQFCYDMNAIGRKSIQKPGGKKSNNTSGRFGYITDGTFRLLCERRGVEPPIAASEAGGEQPSPTRKLHPEPTGQGNGKLETPTTVAAARQSYPDLGIEIDWKKKTVYKDSKTIEFGRNEVEWHILTVAIVAYPNAYSLDDLQKDYPSEWNTAARKTAKSSLNEKLSRFGIRINEERRLVCVGKKSE